MPQETRVNRERNLLMQSRVFEEGKAEALRAYVEAREGSAKLGEEDR